MTKLAVAWGGVARLRRVAASSWAGVSCTRVSWARMLFSARVDGIGPFSSSAEFNRAPRVTDIVARGQVSRSGQ